MPTQFQVRKRGLKRKDKKEKSNKKELKRKGKGHRISSGRIHPSYISPSLFLS